MDSDKMKANTEYELFIFGANVPKSEITLCHDIDDKNKPIGLIKAHIKDNVKVYVFKYIMERCIVTIGYTNSVVSIRALNE